MKAFFPLILSCVIFNVNAEAQYLAGGTLRMGAMRAIPGNAEARNLYNAKFRETYGAGAVLNFQVSKKYALHTELNLSSKTRSVRYNQDDQTVTYKNHHVDLPLLLRFSFPAENKWWGKYRYYLNLGPEISYWLRGKATISNSPAEDYKIGFKGNEERTDFISLENANRWQYGLSFGAGLMIPTLRKQTLMIDLRYFMGQSFIGSVVDQELSNFRYRDDLTARYHIISLAAAYLFDVNLIPSKKGKSTSKIKAVRPK